MKNKEKKGRKSIRNKGIKNGTKSQGRIEPKGKENHSNWMINNKTKNQNGKGLKEAIGVEANEIGKKKSSSLFGQISFFF